MVDECNVHSQITIHPSTVTNHKYTSKFEISESYNDRTLGKPKQNWPGGLATGAVS